MKIKKHLIPLIIVLSFILNFYLYPIMPDQMASHWNARGEVDGYMPKFWGLLILPLTTLGLCLLFITIPKIGPLKKNIQKFRKYYDTLIIIIVGFFFYIYLVTIVWNLGYRFKMNLLMIPAISGLLFYLGILMEKTKRNWFIGIRTPWTLSSDKVWKKTHDVGGKLFKLYAIILLLTLFFEWILIRYFLYVIVLPLISIVIALVVYSYLEYQKVKKD